MAVLILAVAVLLAASDSTMAQEPAAASRWQRVEAWPPGERIVIALRQGGEIAGALKSVNVDGLRLIDATGGERSVPRAQVRQVSGERHDTTLDGLLLGAVIGGGIGALVGYGRRTFECRAGCSIGIGTTLFTPVGALVGWIRDKRRMHTEVLFEAP